MAKVASSGSRVYYDQYKLSGSLTSLGLEITQSSPVTTSLEDAGPRRVPDNYDHKASFLGLFEPTDDDYDEQVFAQLASSGDHYLLQLFGTPAEGNVAYEQIVKASHQPRSTQKGGPVLLNFETEGSDGLFRGTLLRHATVTGAGNGTGRNMGATTSGKKLAIVFRVISLTGTNIAMKIQESSDDGGSDAYADVSGLASGTLTGPAVVFASTTAATEAYKRVVISSPGGFTSALVVVSAGVIAGT